MTLREEGQRVRSGTGPTVFAALRNGAIGYHRTTGSPNITRPIRRVARDSSTLVHDLTSTEPTTHSPFVSPVHFFTGRIIHRDLLVVAGERFPWRLDEVRDKDAETGGQPGERVRRRLGDQVKGSRTGIWALC